MKPNKPNNMDVIELWETLGKAKDDATAALKAFAETYKKLGYDEHTMLANLKDVIYDFTKGKI